LNEKQDFSELFVGIEKMVPTLSGVDTRYVNLDSAASTTSLKAVQDSINQFLPYYSSVHRGNGYKSQLSTEMYERSRATILKFVNADPEEHVCIFGKNTTEAVNKLANRFPFTEERNIVLVTGMEHHSNDLPWRSNAHTIHIALTADGKLDEADFDKKVSTYANRLALVAITGASNVTGFINPIHRLAEKTHSTGAMFMVDCAQLAPHRPVNMGKLDDRGHLDFVTISGHKMYAPFGTGALIGRRDIFNKGEPDFKGGGTVEIVTLEDVVWAETPERDEAGSPNTVGAVALASAAKTLSGISFENIIQHEADLTAYALERLGKLPFIRIYGSDSPASAAVRLGVIPFMVANRSHFEIAAILGYEFGIGVRSGCFCAHPYILHLLGITERESQMIRDQMMSGNRSEMPGFIRASFGLYNTRDDVDRLIEALSEIKEGNYIGDYRQDISTGEYLPKDWKPDYEACFSL
jgi:selenocysteine lyase/cysteine desulfurase